MNSCNTTTCNSPLVNHKRYPNRDCSIRIRCNGLRNICLNVIYKPIVIFMPAFVLNPAKAVHYVTTMQRASYIIIKIYILGTRLHKRWHGMFNNAWYECMHYGGNRMTFLNVMFTPQLFVHVFLHSFTSQFNIKGVVWSIPLNFGDDSR